MKRNCRYALVPQPVASYVVRNFTTLAYPAENLQKVKKDLKEQDYVKELLKVELPALETIEKIDESFRQHLFAQWVMNKEKTSNFDDLKTKLKSLTVQTPIKYKEALDPANFVAISNKIGDLITEVEFNSTHTAKVIVPEALRNVLFKGWEDQGYDFIRLLLHYGATSLIL